ncbi:MAG: nucleotidyltransferase family protein, partial [Desulfobacteraceae bacterium]|nr:nucleotidyltransferase family protein [Desulfobacteraceae bacterium]
MNILDKMEEINVIILCGGQGKRLQSIVNDRPKPMAEVGGRPFLDILIDYVASFGFRRFILCICYMGDFIRRHYQNRKGPLETIFSEEKKPLGTAGAIKKAEPFIGSSPFLVMNGDSFCKVDLRRFLKFHLTTKALSSIVLTNTKDTDSYGNVTLGKSQRIINFSEKTKSHKNSLVSAGIYFFQKEILSLIPANKNFSLEKDLFPSIVDKGFYGYVSTKEFIDIGTPERHKKAREIIEDGVTPENCT